MNLILDRLQEKIKFYKNLFSMVVLIVMIIIINNLNLLAKKLLKI